MSFLAPLFLLGAAAIAAPILFHLIRRTSREKTLFSTLMFLAPTPPRVTRKSRLENILLLLLRCAVLGLLALAFARPFLRNPINAAPTGGDATRMVVLLDTSASLRRENLWSDARSKAVELVRQARPNDEVAILAFDRTARPVLSFQEWRTTPTGDRAALAGQRLDALKPTWNATHLGHALVSGVETLEAERENTMAKRQIVLISDLQDGARLEGLQGLPWPKNTQVTAMPVKAKRRSNAGVHIIASATDTPPTDSSRVRVSNASESTMEQFQLKWAGDLVTSNVVMAYVPPGQSRIVETPKSGGAEQLTLMGDEADFDNAAYVVPPRREQIDLAFVGPDVETDPQQMLFYLKRAFGDTARQEIRVQAVPAAQLTSALPNASVILLASPLARGDVDELARRVRAGATVLATLRTAAEAETLATLVGQTITADEATTTTASYAMLSEIDFTHPLLAPFADPRFSDFTKIHFWKHRRLNFGSATNRVLARFDNGDPALAQFNVGKGAVFVLASGWQPGDSQLALSSKFVPLLYSLLELSGAIKAQSLAYTVGDAVDLSGLHATNALTVRKPDGTTAVLAAGVKSFSETDTPGVYGVTGAEPPFRFAVNLAAEESKTTPLPMEQLEQLGVPLKAIPVGTPQQIARREAQLKATELESHQKLWRWIIAATLVVLIGETWVAARLSRRATAA